MGLEVGGKGLLAHDVERKRFGATMSSRHALAVPELGIAASGAKLDGQILTGEQYIPANASLVIMANVLLVGLATMSSVAD